MALCLANSLVARRDFILYDQLVRYKWWYLNGYMSSTGTCFYIGTASSASLVEFSRRQKEFAEQKNIPLEQLDFLSDPAFLKEFNIHCSEDSVAGNGALMRLVPVPLFFYKYPIEAVEYSCISGILTHGDQKAYDACRYYGALIVAALKGEEKQELLDGDFYSQHKYWFQGKPLHQDIMEIAEGSYKKKGGYNDGIRGKGYIVNVLEGALLAFCSDDGIFKTGVCNAVNLGDDTDTTAAIYGQLVGAYYGYKNLPLERVEKVYARKFIETLSKWIAYEGERWQPDLFSSTIPSSPQPDPPVLKPYVPPTTATTQGIRVVLEPELNSGSFSNNNPLSGIQNDYWNENRFRLPSTESPPLPIFERKPPQHDIRIPYREEMNTRSTLGM